MDAKRNGKDALPDEREDTVRSSQAPRLWSAISLALIGKETTSEKPAGNIRSKP
jgi:hypothetical protein